MQPRIEGIVAPGRPRCGRRIDRRGGHRRARRRSRRRRSTARSHLLEPILGIVLHALELHLQLLVLMLQLLDGAGELAQRVLDAVDAHGVAGVVGLRILLLLDRVLRRRCSRG